MFSRKLIATVFMALSVLLLAGCGASQPQSVAQSSQQTEAQPEVTVPTTESAEEHEEEEHNEEAEEHDEDHELSLDEMELTPVTLAEGEKLQVVATSNIIGDMVKNVAGDLVELTVLMPPGSDPHAFQPAPQDAAAVADADVVFANGLNFEEFLDDFLLEYK